jgi:hypothetical protein
MLIRGVNVRYDHLRIKQNDDVVGKEADLIWFFASITSRQA